jgi:hypothetical protein
MPEQDFIVFAGGVGANVITQATYVAASWPPTGFASGLAQSNQFNKVFRQGSIMAAVIGQMIADVLGVNVIDDGTTATIEANLIKLIRGGAGAFVTDTGAANALVGLLTPAPANLASLVGIPILVKAAHTNTGASTINVNGFGAVNITTQTGAALAASALTANGIYWLVYDGTEFQLVL